MAKPATQDIPSTAYAILGLLSFGEMSGYDVAKMVERSIAYFFSPAKSHIYGELRRLVAHGYANERTIRQADRPDKRMYRITQRGRTALRRWLESPSDEPEMFRSPALLRLFFGHMTSVETLTTQIKEYRAQAQAQLEEFKAIERGIQSNPETLFPYLTLRCGLAHVRASIRWADEVLSELAKRGRSDGD